LFLKSKPPNQKELVLQRSTCAGRAKSRGGGAVIGRAGGILFALIFGTFVSRQKYEREKK